MTAALKRSAAQRRSSRRSAQGKRTSVKNPSNSNRDSQRSTVVPLQSPGQSSRGNSSVVKVLPTAKPLPFWVKSLIVVQRGTAVLSLVLVLSGLAVYGWTVYTQQRWGHAYGRLERLQKRERQLLAANEVLKNQIAKQAEAPGAGLVLPNPDDTIFLSPAPLRPTVKPEVDSPSPEPIPARPLGY